LAGCVIAPTVALNSHERSDFDCQVQSQLRWEPCRDQNGRNTVTQAQDDSPEETADLDPSVDWLLRTMVRAANAGPASGQQSVTLCVKGLVVTGRIISADAYLKQVFDVGKTPAEDQTSDQSAIAEALEDAASKPTPLPEYIHLQNAQVYVGNAVVPTTGGTLWRGRLREVDGFSLGSVKAARS
jgi:hypothetical protein